MARLPRALSVVTAVVMLGALGLVATGALASTLPHALVLSVHATPGTLPSGGGQVIVSGTVEHASTCQLELLSTQPFPVVYSHDPKGCVSGSYSAKVVIEANPTPVKRTVAFAVVARNETSSSTGRFYVALAEGRIPTSTLLGVMQAFCGICGDNADLSVTVVTDAESTVLQGTVRYWQDGSLLCDKVEGSPGGYVLPVTKTCFTNVFSGEVRAYYSGTAHYLPSSGTQNVTVLPG